MRKLSSSIKSYFMDLNISYNLPKCSFRINVEAFSFSTAIIDRKLAGDCQGVTQLRLSSPAVFISCKICNQGCIFSIIPFIFIIKKIEFKKKSLEDT